jgi:hypothetical protein
MKPVPVITKDEARPVFIEMNDPLSSCFDHQNDDKSAKSAALCTYSVT